MTRRVWEPFRTYSEVFGATGLDQAAQHMTPHDSTANLQRSALRLHRLSGSPELPVLCFSERRAPGDLSRSSNRLACRVVSGGRVPSAPPSLWSTIRDSPVQCLPDPPRRRPSITVLHLSGRCRSRGPADLELFSISAESRYGAPVARNLRPKISHGSIPDEDVLRSKIAETNAGTISAVS